MFVRVKKVGAYRYLQIAEIRREGKRVKQTIIATLGRLDKLAASGAFDQLLRSEETVREVVTHPESDPLAMIQRNTTDRVDEADVDNVRALIIDELRRLHEGVLARYGLRLSELSRWGARQPGI